MTPERESYSRTRRRSDAMAISGSIGSCSLLLLKLMSVSSQREPISSDILPFSRSSDQPNFFTLPFSTVTPHYFITLLLGQSHLLLFFSLYSALLKAFHTAITIALSSSNVLLAAISGEHGIR